MPNYLVERSLPDVGDLTSLELSSIAQQIHLVVLELDSKIQWLHTIITADRMIGLFVADDETAVREHARRCGLPIQRISEVSAVIGPTTETSGVTPNGMDVGIETSTRLPVDRDNPLYCPQS